MSKYQKRISSPNYYPVKHEEGYYVLKGEGPYGESEGLPLGVVLRDVLGYAEDLDEAEEILSRGQVLVNGSPRKNPNSTVGFMDSVSFPEIDEHFRVLVTSQGFALKEVDEEDAYRKLARVDDKTTLKGGVTQLNLYDGNNIETEEDYDTKSSLLVTLPDLEIEDEIRMEEGNLAYIRDGKHTGEVAEIVDIEELPGSRPANVTLEGEEGEFQTVEDNVYMVGEDEPEVDVE